MNKLTCSNPSNRQVKRQPKAEVFVSYSANFEDVMLHRAFANVSKGFYVDVGAAHPTFENDTRALYDAGWHGVNIEPNEGFFNSLAEERTRDVNLNIALSDVAGTIDYYEVIGTGLSTCQGKFADKAKTKGYEVIRRTIEASTLAAVLDRVRPVSIELLKVDVEGFEERVLAGNDWSKYRPSVIVVEATYPETQTRREAGVRKYLEGKNYHWRYFDGLNDFYIAREFDLPKTVFDRPPNIFDRFKLRETVELIQIVPPLRAENELLKRDIDKERLERSRAQDSVDLLAQEKGALRHELDKERAERHREQKRSEVLARQSEKLSFDLADEKMERGRLQSASEQLRRDIVAYSQDLEISHFEAAELRPKVIFLEAELVAKASALEAQIATGAQLATKVHGLEAQLAATAGALEAQLAGEAQLRAKMRDLEDQVAARTSAFDAQVENEAQLRAKMRDLEDQVAANATAFETQLASEAELATKIRELETQLTAEASAFEAQLTTAARLAAANIRDLEDQLAAKVTELEARVASEARLRVEVNTLEAQLAVASQEIRRGDAAYQAVLTSTSWRLTRPVRMVGKVIKRSL